MTGLDIFDDAAADRKRFETNLLAQDQSAVRVSTADIDERAARRLVSDLVDDGVVVPVADQRTLVHEPSGEAFDSIRQLAVFHRGWTAGREADERPS
jgi:hypothetical protein